MSQKVQVILEVTSKGMDAFGKVSGQLDRFQNKVTGVFNSLVNLPNIIVGTGAALAVKSFLQADMQLEAMENRMSAAVGKFTDSAEELKYIREEADRVGVKFTDLATSYSGFAAATTRAGISMESTRQIFKEISETAVSLKLSPERIKLVFMALEQMASKGVVSMEELRRQLGDSFPAAMEIGALAMNMGTQEFNKLVASGNLLSADFLPRFSKQVREELGGSFELSSNQLQANVERMGNAWFDLKQKTGEALNPIVNEIIPGLIEAMERVEENSGKITAVINIATVAVTALANAFQIAGDVVAAALLYIYNIGKLVFTQLFGWIDILSYAFTDFFSYVAKLGGALFSNKPVKDAFKDFIDVFTEDIGSAFKNTINEYNETSKGTSEAIDGLINTWRVSGAEFEKNIDDIANSMLKAQQRMAEKVDPKKNGVFEKIVPIAGTPKSASWEERKKRVDWDDFDPNMTWKLNQLTPIATAAMDKQNAKMIEGQEKTLSELFAKYSSFTVKTMTLDEVAAQRRKDLWKDTQSAIEGTLKSSFMTIVSLEGTMAEKMKSIFEGIYSTFMSILYDYLAEYVKVKIFEMTTGIATEKAKQAEATSTAYMNAADAGAGAASSVAKIPYAGPILAVAALATVFGAIAAVIASARGHAHGSDYTHPGLSWVGENGPELRYIGGGEKIIPNNKIGGLGGDVNISLTVNGNMDQDVANKTVSRLKQISTDIQNAIRFKYLNPALLRG